MNQVLIKLLTNANFPLFAFFAHFAFQAFFARGVLWDLPKVLD